MRAHMATEGERFWLAEVVHRRCGETREPGQRGYRGREEQKAGPSGARRRLEAQRCCRPVVGP